MALMEMIEARTPISLTSNDQAASENHPSDPLHGDRGDRPPKDPADRARQEAVLLVAGSWSPAGRALTCASTSPATAVTSRAATLPTGAAAGAPPGTSPWTSSRR